MKKPVRFLLLTMLMLTLLSGAAMAAGAATTIDHITAAAANVRPVLGKTAAVNLGDVTITAPEDGLVKVDPNESGRYWRYSADGETWENCYPSDNKVFTQGYWQCRLNFWIDSPESIVFAEDCVVTVNGARWSSSVTGDSMAYAQSPVYVVDGSGTILEEIGSVSLNCATFPSLFTDGKKPTAPGDYVTTAGLAVIDSTKDVWQVRVGDTWRDLAAEEACVGGSAYRLKTTLTLPENHDFLVTLGRAVALTVNGNAWTVDHASMENRGTTEASVTVYSHTVYAANETCTVTFYDVNKPSGENVVGTVEVSGGVYTLPECTFPASHKDIIFDYWECEDVDGSDVKKQPGETIVLLQDSTIYLYWKWKPGVNRVSFDLAVSGNYAYGMQAGALSVSLEGGQHVSMEAGGYGHGYWIECGNQKVDPAETLSAAALYQAAVRFRLEDGYMAAFTENSVTLRSNVLGELACRTPVEQEDGSYIAYFSLPNVPGTPISADKVTFALAGYEAGKMVQAITPTIATEDVVFNGSGYGKQADGCAYVIYRESDEAYVYQKPVYDSASFWASTDYWLDIRFTLKDGCSLPDSFWSGGTLNKEKFVLSGVAGAAVETVSRSGSGFYIRFKLPQLGNVPIGAVRVNLDGYQAGTQAQDVVVTFSENISPFRYTPQEHYQNQHYYFCTPNGEDYDELVGAYTTLQEGNDYRFVVWLNVAEGYDASDMVPSDLVIHTRYGDRTATAIETGIGESSYKVTFDLPVIGEPYILTFLPGEGSGSMPRQTGVQGAYTLPTHSFIGPSGKSFAGWSVNGVEKAAGDVITVDRDLTITALWSFPIIVMQKLSAPWPGDVLDSSMHTGVVPAVFGMHQGGKWYDVTGGSSAAISNGTVFQPGHTYQYVVKIKLDPMDYPTTDPEELVLKLAGVNQSCYAVTKKTFSNRMTNSVIWNCTIEFYCPSITGSVKVTGSAAHPQILADNISRSAVLVVAQYSGGRMADVRMLTITTDGTFTPDPPFTHRVGCTYQAFLLDAESYAPLCTAAPLSD